MEHIKTKNISDFILYYIFLLYFGVTPIYNMLVAYKVIPNIYFSSIIILLFPIYLFLSIPFLKRHKLKFNINLVIVFLIILIFVIQIISYPTIRKYNNSMKAYIDVLQNTIFFTSIMLCFGKNISNLYNLFKNNKRIRVLTYFIYIIFSIVIFFGIFLNKKYSLGGFQVYHDLEQNSTVTYLMIGDNLAIFSLFLLNLTENKKKKLGISIFGGILLSATLSRASFILYIFTLAILFILMNDKKTKVTIIFIIVLIISYIFLKHIDFMRFLESSNNRTLISLSRGLEKDTSYAGRVYFKNIGLNDLKNIWFFGSFMREYQIFGCGGSYIHNWLSFWVAYGIIPFIIFVVISLILICKIITLKLKYPDNEFICLVFSISIFCYLNIILFKSYVWPYIWFAVSSISQVDKYINKK